MGRMGPRRKSLYWPSSSYTRASLIFQITEAKEKPLWSAWMICNKNRPRIFYVNAITLPNFDREDQLVTISDCGKLYTELLFQHNVSSVWRLKNGSNLWLPLGLEWGEKWSTLFECHWSNGEIVWLANVSLHILSLSDQFWTLRVISTAFGTRSKEFVESFQQPSGRHSLW